MGDWASGMVWEYYGGGCVESMRGAVLWNIPVACNRASADFLISSPLMNSYATASRPAI